MNFKKFLKKYGTRLTVMLVGVVVIVSVSAVFLQGQAGLISDTAGVLKTPVQNASSTVIEWFESLYGYIYEYDKLVAENSSLRDQLAEAQTEARENAAASEENVALRELLNLSQKNSDFVFESATIISWNSSNWTSSFTLSKGESSGLAVGQQVVTEAGELVGQITETGETWANVSTIIDVQANIGVLIGETESAAMSIGDFTMMQDGTAKIYHMTDSSAMLIGDVVLTSGRGDSFAQGLVLGYIEDILTEAGGQMPYGVLRPACDFDSLSQVFVVKEFSVIE